MPDHRKAKVQVQNQTGADMFAISVRHKYSDNYKNDKEWDIIKNGESSVEQLEVDYHTGFLTTGTDWWAISWYRVDMSQVYYSNPNNFRGAIDFAESISPEILSKAASVAANYASGGNAGSGTPIGDTVTALARETSCALFNSEKTAGFKMHTLRDEDANKVTTITVRANGTIQLSSPSGDSETVYSQKDAPGT